MAGWAAAIGPIIQMVTGAIKSAQTKKALSELPSPQQFTISPEMRRGLGMAERRQEMGLSPAERAAAEQGMSRRASAAERTMRNLGTPGIAPMVSSLYNVDYLTKLAEVSEAERRRGEQMYMGQAARLQAQENMDVAAANERLRQAQVALGQAGAAAGQDMSGGAMGIASAASGMLGGGGAGDALGGMAAGFGRMASPDAATEFQTYSDDLLKSGTQGYDFMGGGFSQGVPNYYGTTNNLYGANIGDLNQSGLNTGGGYFPGDQFQNQNAGSQAPIGSYEYYMQGQ
jgi:hypothetical protein